MTPAQCRAARALVELTQPSLAAAAKLSLSTGVDFERSRRAVSLVAIKAMREALERHDVLFLDENGQGPGVRLRKSGLKLRK